MFDKLGNLPLNHLFDDTQQDQLLGGGDNTTFADNDSELDQMLAANQMAGNYDHSGVLELEGITQGPSASLGAEEGSWVVLVDGNVLLPDTMPGDNHSIDLGHESSGAILISDGMGSFEQISFEHTSHIAWEPPIV